MDAVAGVASGGAGQTPAPAAPPVASTSIPAPKHAGVAVDAAPSPVAATPTPPGGAPVAVDAASTGAIHGDAATQPSTAKSAAAPPALRNVVEFPLRPATTRAHVAQPSGAAPGADAGSIGGAVFSLLLVIGLVLGLGWLARRMPGMQRGIGTAQLKVVASVALGPRDRAVVLDVGGRQLLLGVGAGGVRALHTLEHPLPVVESTAPSAFAQVLAQHFGRKT